MIHVAFITILMLVGFAVPRPPEEDGMPVMLGEVPDALGMADPSLVEVDVAPEEKVPQMEEAGEQNIITQEDEETVVLKPKSEP